MKTRNRLVNPRDSVHALAALALLVTATTASAAKWECGERSNLSVEGKNYCAAGDFRQSEFRLQKAFDALLKKFSKTHSDVSTLTDAQNAFESYRDNQCAAENKRIEEKPYHSMVVAQCKSRLTNIRIDELRGMLEQD